MERKFRCRSWPRTNDLRVSPRCSAFTELYGIPFIYGFLFQHRPDRANQPVNIRADVSAKEINSSFHTLPPIARRQNHPDVVQFGSSIVSLASPIPPWGGYFVMYQ